MVCAPNQSRMRNPHNAISDVLFALGLDALLDDETQADPNNTAHWTILLKCKAGVSTTHPLHNVSIAITPHAWGGGCVRVLGSDEALGHGMERPLCTGLLHALQD